MILPEKRPRVLAIGAHPDDIELGAGGFIHRLVHKHKAIVKFLILTEGRQAPAPGTRYRPSVRKREAIQAAKYLGIRRVRKNVKMLQFPDCSLHEYGHEVIKAIEKKLYNRNRKPRFDLVLTHAEKDTHADHRTVHESTLSAARDFHRTLLLYQAPSTQPNGFHPTFFVRLDKNEIKKKCTSIAAHVSQKRKPFTKDSRTIGLANTWSVFLRLPPKSYVEAFEVHKSFF